MKILHLSDLHIGKKINEFSMIEDQKFILEKILEIIDSVKPNVILIAGDIYDKMIPSTEAVELLDNFINKISKRKIDTFIISGNHDSEQRLSFGANIMKNGKIYISPVFDGKICKYELEDKFGKINFYLLPFLKIINIKKYFPDEKIDSYTDAMKVLIKNMELDTSKRNILVAHQYVVKNNFDEKDIGGIECISSDIFSDFDYVALGHIHRAYNIENNGKIRYCGSPLKYSFSEINFQKSVTVVDIKEKNNFKIETIALNPLRDMKTIKGNFSEIIKKSFYEKLKTDDYFFITLTDENDIVNAMTKLREIYPNIMKLDYDNLRTQKLQNYNLIDYEKIKNDSPFDLFSQFYEIQNNQKMTEEQEKIMKNLIDEVWEGE